MPSRPIAIFALACLLLALLIGGAAVWLSNRRAATTDAEGQPVVTYGRADIGGPFQLVDQTGRTVDESILEGRWSAVFFGFTHCPDYCPSTLQALAAAQARLGPAAEDLQIIFVSVDPERDTPEALADYLQTSSFPLGVVGLTGTSDQVRSAAEAYRVHYARRDLPGGGYTMDHSLTLYLMNPDGEFATPLSHSRGPQRLANLIQEAMEREG